MRRTALLLAVGLLFPAASLAAQSAQPISLQGSLLAAGFGGKAFEDQGVTFGPGAGMEAQVRYNPSAFSIGVGLQYTIHPVDADFLTGDATATLDFAGIFVEPRYVIFVGSERAAPYVSARIMRLVSTLRLNNLPLLGDVTDTADAWGFNVGGGILIRATSQINLDLGLTLGGIAFDYGDPAVENDSGANAVLRAGLVLGL